MHAAPRSPALMQHLRRPNVPLPWMLVCVFFGAALNACIHGVRLHTSLSHVAGGWDIPFQHQQSKPRHCRLDLPGCVPEDIKYVYFLHAPKASSAAAPLA